MQVKLLAHTPNAEEVIASAGKLCYSPVGVDDISEKLDKKSTEKYISMLINLGHYSPLEHASFTFAVEGVSRTLSHQLVRHRLASYSQQSQRYVRLDDFQYIIPPAIENDSRAKEIFLQSMKADQKAYDELTEILFDKNYKDLLKEGLSEKEAKNKAIKSAIEDARYVFPNACETKIVFTMNARTLLHFFSLRCCNRAQWEIRSLAFEMVKILKETYPILFKNAGPSCINGPCPEGKMTCGKIKEVREKYSNL